MNKIAATFFAVLMLTGIMMPLTLAAYHDCGHNPPLQSFFFGQRVPVETICSLLP